MEKYLSPLPHIVLVFSPRRGEKRKKMFSFLLIFSTYFFYLPFSRVNFAEYIPLSFCVTHCFFLMKKISEILKLYINEVVAGTW